jgi:hypothetical protein
LLGDAEAITRAPIAVRFTGPKVEKDVKFVGEE